ncbi:MAG: Sapep family Mn(2+)-dependent dipeptidase [Bacillota bacterium]
MNTAVDSIICGLTDEIVSDVRQTIRFRSVRGPAAGRGAPFGEEIKQCLDYVLNLAKTMGFAVKNLDGYAGVIDYDCGCDETFGVLCHLDVVPAGSGWIHDPFAAQMGGKRIYGRGALDNKGPALSSLYALHSVKRAGVPLRRNVRIILGCDEETGWQCMEHYRSVEPLPDLAISPDAKYPLIWSEKNVLQASYAKKFSSRITADAGTMPNVVPGEARCRIPLAPESVCAAASAVEAETGCTVLLNAEGVGARILVRGASAHASRPEQGNNAAAALLSLLARLPLGSDSDMANALAERFCDDLNGQWIGIDHADETGRTSMNLGILRWNEAGIERLTVDTRFPFSLSIDMAQKALEEALLPLGFLPLGTYQKAIHIVPRESELVTTLLDVYERRAGARLEPIADGSITYARTIPNAVAFGCGRPGRGECIHMPEEHITVEDLMFNTHMLADAILALAGDQPA